MNLKKIFSENPLIAASVIYLLLAFLLMPAFIHWINPDGISYISIGYKYLNGDFLNAVNGYWGPLFSWLMTPFLYLGFEGYTAARLVQIFAGLIMLFSVDSVVKSADILHDLRPWLLMAAIPVTISCAYWSVTPDLILTVSLLLYYSSVINKRYRSRKYFGIITGICGAAAFYSKSYGLPFFLGHFIIYNIYLYFRSRETRKVQAINFAAGLICFLMFSAAWSAALSYKYGRPLWTTSGKINHAIYSPEANGKHLPIMGINPPVNNTAISVWEDPSNLEYHDWNPFSSRELFIYQLKLILLNIVKLVKYTLVFSPLFFPLFFFTWKKTREREFLFVSLLSLLFYTAGYLLLAMETRYVWFSYYLIIILSFLLYDAFIKGRQFGFFKLSLVNLLFILSFVPFPVYALSLSFMQGEKIYNMSQVIGRYVKEGDSIVSDGEYIPSLYMSFFRNMKYYGEADFETKEDAEKMIRSYKIRYFLLWNSKNLERYPFLKNEARYICRFGDRGRLYRIDHEEYTGK